MVIGKKIKLVTDLWLVGRAFNNGWELHSKSKISNEELKTITHLWFSHEHPDHFNIFTLKSIPIEIRKNITILFQDTLDHRVYKKCVDLGFKKVVELQPDMKYQLDDDFKIRCVPVPFYDSWLLIETENLKILNLNDCNIDTIEKAKEIYKITGNVDILLTQFGYASKVGNKEEFILRSIESQKVLNKIALQSNYLKPKIIIPFASFIRYCHKDNLYMNDSMNKIEDVELFIKKHTESTPIILYCNETWVPFEKHDNKKAIERFKEDLEKPIDVYTKENKIDICDLQKACNDYRIRIKKKNSFTLIKLLYKKNFFSKAKIFLRDLDIAVEFDLIYGITLGEFKKEDADIITDSDSLLFVFNYEYGADTIHVNARYETSGGNPSNFFGVFRIGTLNNNGRTISYLIKRGIKTKLGKLI